MSIHNIFLEYRTESNAAELRQIGVTDVMVPLEKLTKVRREAFRRQRIRVGAVVTAFEAGVCPLNPTAQDQLDANIEKAIAFNPSVIWLDRFHFDGQWEKANKDIIPAAHAPCDDCNGKDRSTELARIALETSSLIPLRIEFGYFATPSNPWVYNFNILLGQDHNKLSLLFDLVAPMLCHRTLNQPVEYISNTVRWFTLRSGATIPLIQVQDSTGAKIDTLSETEIRAAFHHANSARVEGVAWFSWDHAIETGKKDLIASCIRSAITR